MLNGLTIDVEDWHQLVQWKCSGELPSCSKNVVSLTEQLLDHLDGSGVRATFFVLGLVAQAYPDLVRRIQRSGHEIGSHGFSHRLVYRQSQREFREETHRSKSLLEDLLGTEVLGYRAAEFSITNDSLWALDALAELGFGYDSSVFPIAGPRYGIPTAPTHPTRITTPGGGSIVEFPLTAFAAAGRQWPVGGGGYFRLMPYAWTRSILRRVNCEGRPFVAYFHPYEFSVTPLKTPFPVEGLGRRILWARYVTVHNFGRARVRQRFRSLLTDFNLCPLKELLNHEQLG